jgi:uncharacterized oligopeptide transporter (OPT) family protein
MIMGHRTGLSMLLGTIIGWGILGPIANNAGWTPGYVLCDVLIDPTLICSNALSHFHYRSATLSLVV